VPTQPIGVASRVLGALGPEAHSPHWLLSLRFVQTNAPTSRCRKRCTSALTASTSLLSHSTAVSSSVGTFFSSELTFLIYRIRIHSLYVSESSQAGGPPFRTDFDFSSRNGISGAPSLRFLQGREPCCRYHRVSHVALPATLLRRPSPALYHVFLLPAQATSAERGQTRPVLEDSGTGSQALPVCGCWLCGDAGAHSSFDQRAGSGDTFHGAAGIEAALGAGFAAHEQEPDVRQSNLFGEVPARGPFWQARFYDFNVWTDKKRVQKLRYMHQNPLKRGLVPTPEDWPWSSYRFYAFDEAGLVRVNEGWGEISFRDRVA